VEEFSLKNFQLITLEPYVYRLFKDQQNIYLLEVSCGTHGIWEVWIKLNEEEIKLYLDEKELGLKEIAGFFSFNCYGSEYQKRYVKVYK